jgi:hypothetical protein
MNLTFKKNYFAITVLLFFTEILIALFVTDSFIRPYFGDVLVVILIYCLVKSFLQIDIFPLAVGVLAFSFFIEFLQYLNIIEQLGLGNSGLAKTIIGNSFSWKDNIAYLTGFLIVLLAEKFRVPINN